MIGSFCFHRPLVLFCLMVSGCTQAVLTPFSEVQVEPVPGVRVLVTLEAPEFGPFPEGTLFFLDIPEWNVLGAPAFMMDGLLRADFSVSSGLLVEGAPVMALLFPSDPDLCPETPPQEATGYVTDWIVEERTARFVLEGPEAMWVCE